MKRQVLISLGAFAIFLAVGAAALAADGGEGRTSAGVQFAEPPRIKSSNHQLELILEAAEKEFFAGGERVIGDAYTANYNGEKTPAGLVGPTLVLKPGDTLKLRLRNELPPKMQSVPKNVCMPMEDVTNIHFHGFHVSPLPPLGDQVVKTLVKPGETHRYKIEIPGNHDQGTYWYHAHPHCLTERQVFRGLAGVALIGTPKMPRGITPSHERVLALKDFKVGNERQIDPEVDNKYTVRTVNGLLKPQISGRPGEIELWHLANISANTFYDLQLKGTPFQVIATDGNPEEKVWETNHLVMPPARRFDVLVKFGAPGPYELKTLTYSKFENGEKPFPEATLATVNVAGKRVQSPPLPKHARLGREKLPQRTAHRTKVLTQAPDGSKFMINGTTFDPTRIDKRIPLGAVEDWTLVNRTDEQHPIHVHQNAFWVVERNGKPVTPDGKQDTVIVPPGKSVTIRIPFEDFTGEFVFHCHILFHEDHGMMSAIEVVKPKSSK